MALALFLVACGSSAPPPVPQAKAATPAPVGGCRDVFLYGSNADRTQFVIVDVDAKAVGLEPGQTKTFDLANAPKDTVKVWLDVYLQPARGEIHCTDAKTRSEAQMAERYAATSGRLTLEMQPDGSGKTYLVTAVLEAARFSLEGRPEIDIGSRHFEHVRVGWLPG